MTDSLLLKMLEQRRKELEAPLSLYLEQNAALELDIALAALDGQRQVILRTRQEKVQDEISRILAEIARIDDEIHEHGDSSIASCLSMGSQQSLQQQKAMKQSQSVVEESVRPSKTEGTVVSSTSSVLNTGKGWAVLVGVNLYENQPHIPSLHVCVDDVAAVHAALVGKYTAARLLTDNTPERLPTRANILAELSSVAQAAGEGDLLLFYFSGHGIAEGGESYLLPRDARLAALKHTAVAMKDVREIIEASPARAKVIVLDACHSGAAIGKAGPAMTLEFVQRVFTEAEGMAVLASCKQGQQSWEWPEKKRSVFTHFLLEALSGKADFDGKGFVTVSDASRHVTDGVKAWAVDHGVPQTPTLQYTVAGDIILIRSA